MKYIACTNFQWSRKMLSSLESFWPASAKTDQQTMVVGLPDILFLC